MEYPVQYNGDPTVWRNPVVLSGMLVPLGRGLRSWIPTPSSPSQLEAEQLLLMALTWWLLHDTWFFSLKKYVCMYVCSYLKIRVREREKESMSETEKEIAHLLAHSASDLNSWDPARSKQVLEFHPGFPQGCRGPTVFPGTLAGSRATRTHSSFACWCCKQRFNMLCHNAGFWHFIWINMFHSVFH